MGEFSGVLQLTDLNDFIGPGQECVKPIQAVAVRRPKKINADAADFESSSIEVVEEPVKKAQITLNDCLACSGCVTSAETVLIAEQTHEKFLEILAKNATTTSASNRLVVVVSVAPQVQASLAARFQLNMPEAGEHLCGMLQTLGVDYIFDIQLARNLSLYESAKEFVNRYNERRNSSASSSSLPMIASACPGWICYAEKSHGKFILPYIDTTKSPQQIMGSLVKNIYNKELVHACRGDREDHDADDASSIFHVSLMPCYDKKLEASRADFYNDILSTRDVDMVITSIEIEDLIIRKLQRKCLTEFPRRPYDKLLQHSPRMQQKSSNVDESASHFGGGSGGYCENIFVYAARKLFHENGVQPGQLQYRVQRNQDFQELTLRVGNEDKLKFAICYGFRNIQNIVMKLKRPNACPYHYVEIMACPSACLNGGGQIRPYDFELQQTVTNDEVVRKKWLSHVQQLYESLPKRALLLGGDQQNAAEFDDWLNEFYADVCERSAKRSDERNNEVSVLHTKYHAVERPGNALNIKW